MIVGATLNIVSEALFLAKKIGADLAAKGAGMIDAPLGRTPAHAKDGMLNIMAAGDKENFEKVEPTLNILGENIFYLGALGAGHTTKLINNFMGMTSVSSMSQAFAVAELAGVNRNKLYDIMSIGLSNSPFMAFAKNYAVDGVSACTAAGTNAATCAAAEGADQAQVEACLAEATNGEEACTAIGDCTYTPGDGSALIIQGQAGAAGFNGGDVVLQAGASDTGTHGNLILAGATVDDVVTVTDTQVHRHATGWQSDATNPSAQLHITMRGVCLSCTCTCTCTCLQKRR
jgi:hypothetical protein